MPNFCFARTALMNSPYPHARSRTLSSGLTKRLENSPQSTQRFQTIKHARSPLVEVVPRGRLGLLSETLSEIRSKSTKFPTKFPTKGAGRRFWDKPLNTQLASGDVGVVGRALRCAPVFGRIAQFAQRSAYRHLVLGEALASNLPNKIQVSNSWELLYIVRGKAS